ncbi:MAG: hypothetical protein JSW54_01905, partial [Fidelibacterota bacterium]
MKSSLLAALSLITALQAQSARITSVWSADTVYIGQPVILRLSVDLPAGDVPHFPDLTVTNPAASLVNTYLEPAAVEYVLNFWELGKVTLPGIPVKIVSQDGTERILQTDSLSIFVASALTGQEQDIHEIKSMVPVILRDPRSLAIRIGILVLLLGAI